jgi:DUF1680 family protein
MEARFVSPHPYTNQDIISLARGPLIYCVEDVDNLWVDDHFKTLLFKPSAATISESQRTDKETGETYIALSASGAACSFLDVRTQGGPGLPIANIGAGDENSVGELHFVPFYYRANRGGRGQMRVGLRKRW